MHVRNYVYADVYMRAFVDDIDEDIEGDPMDDPESVDRSGKLSA